MGVSSVDWAAAQDASVVLPRAAAIVALRIVTHHKIVAVESRSSPDAPVATGAGIGETYPTTHQCLERTTIITKPSGTRLVHSEDGNGLFSHSRQPVTHVSPLPANHQPSYEGLFREPADREGSPRTPHDD
jgi:hypothetical protein